jgi:hypothetical protein
MIDRDHLSQILALLVQTQHREGIGRRNSGENWVKVLAVETLDEL